MSHPLTFRRVLTLGQAVAQVLRALLFCCGVAVVSHAQPPAYYWSNFAGQPGGFGNVDGTGSAARFLQPYGVAVDGSGNVYVADQGNETIRKITSDGVVTTLAGQAGSYGSADGTGSAARFSGPTGVAVDGSGNVYVADQQNHTIRKITSDGVVTTLAGLAGYSGSTNGTGGAARFNHPCGVAVDGMGNVYVADQDNQTIRQITSDGVVTTLAGQPGWSGSADGAGGAARFSSPTSVAVDDNGNVYVADTGNQTIRQITGARVVTTLAGSAGSSGSADGPGSAARFSTPIGVAVDGSGTVYVGDDGNSTIRQISGAGVVMTLAGSAGSKGSADGTGGTARFYGPFGVAVDGSGNVYVVDRVNVTIRQITNTGVVTTLAGSAQHSGSADGTGNAARFHFPVGVAMDGSGNIYVADQLNETIREITDAGVVTTLAGLAGNSGSADGTGSAARFNYPAGVAVDGSGNVYVADEINSTIRQISSAGVVTTLAGSAGGFGSKDGTGSAARFNSPTGVTVDGSGNVYVADAGNQSIRKVTSEGVVTTLAGQEFNKPTGVAVDGSGNVYVADSGNFTIRKITADGTVSTLAGSAGSSGSVDGAGSAALFKYPCAVAVDESGNVYVADGQNSTIRMITSAGVVTTIGGSPGVASSADGLGAAAIFDFPGGIAVNGSGSAIFVVDTDNHRVVQGVLAAVPSLAAGTEVVSGPNSATLGGNVTSDGGAPIAARGVVYAPTATNSNPQLGDDDVQVASDAAQTTGVFSENVTGLSPNTGYSFAAYATNADGTVYLPVSTFATPDFPPSGLTYASNPATYAKGVAIAPNSPTHSGGVVTSYRVESALPAGLALDAGTGVVSGTPTDAAATADYTITATNGAGSATVALTITVESDSVVAFAASTGNINPVDEAAQPNLVNVTITRTNALNPGVSVQVRAEAPGSVPTGFKSYTYGQQYKFADESSPGVATVQFADGETSVAVRIQLAASAASAPGVFGLSLQSSGGFAALGSPSGMTVTVGKHDKTPPVLTLASPTQGTAGATFTVQGAVKENDALSSFTVTLNGVPLTLTVDPMAAFVAGQPVTFAVVSVPAENGSNTLAIEAVDASGNKTTLRKTLTFVDHRPELAGTYAALIRPTGAPSNENTGLLTVTVTATGAFTGKAMLGGKSTPLSGVLGDSGAARFRPGLASTEALAAGPTALGALSFQVTAEAGLSGTLAAPPVAGQSGTTLASFSAQPAHPAPPALLNQPAGRPTRGYYTFAIPSVGQTPPLDPSLYPQGAGFGTLTLQKTGSVAVSGHLADGTAFSASAKLRADMNETVPLFLPLYGKAGFFTGELAFANGAQSDVGGSGFTWLRPANTTAGFYRGGWPAGLTLAVAGAKYAAPASLDFGQGPANAASGNAALVFEDGVSLGLGSDPVSLDPGTGHVRLVPMGTRACTLSLTAATGLFNGSFLNGEGKKESYAGVLVDKGGSGGGFGYYLQPPATGSPGSGLGGNATLGPLGSADPRP